MDVVLVLRHRLKELGLEQRDLAKAAGVTESYISQLLNGKKSPPTPGRTQIYEEMEAFLKLPKGELSRLAELQLIDELKSRLGDPPRPLFSEVRILILRKCAQENERRIRAIFQKEPFGETERLVTQKLMDVVKGVVREESGRDGWLQEVSRLSRRSRRQIRAGIPEFLETDVFHVSTDYCVLFLGPVIESWDIDLESFAIEIMLNPRLASRHVRRLEFAENEPGEPVTDEPGLEDFLHNAQLRSHITDEEVEFLRTLRFRGRRPTALFYYRELQNLRDPLHFSAQ